MFSAKSIYLAREREMRYPIQPAGRRFRGVSWMGGCFL